MKLRIIVCGLAWTLSLCAQKRFSWQDACFKNPGLPYCPGHEFAVKHTRPKAAGKADMNTATSLSAAGQTVDAGGIDWRFADPAADGLAVLNCSRLAGSTVAHRLIDQLGADDGKDRAEIENLFRALSSVEQVALSEHGDRIVLLVTGRAPDAILPAPEVGWKAKPIAGNAMLIGHTAAVEQAFERISTESPLGELAVMALEREADGEFWAAGIAKLAGQQAVKAGVKRFSLTASTRPRFASEIAFEFDAVPDATAIREWLNTLGDAKIEDNVLHVTMPMESEETESGKVAGSLAGRRLKALIHSSRYLPVRDTATTKHTRPVIYGLDEGPAESKQSVAESPDPPPATNSSASASPTQPVTSLSGRWGFTHAEGRFEGVIELRQTGSAITGTWHTSSRSESDSPVAGRIDGHTVILTRFVGSNQTFVLTLSADGNRLDGFGEGWFLNHTNLNMLRGRR